MLLISINGQYTISAKLQITENGIIIYFYGKFEFNNTLQQFIPN